MVGPLLLGTTLGVGASHSRPGCHPSGRACSLGGSRFHPWREATMCIACLFEAYLLTADDEEEIWVLTRALEEMTHVCYESAP